MTTTQTTYPTVQFAHPVGDVSALTAVFVVEEPPIGERAGMFEVRAYHPMGGYVPIKRFHVRFLAEDFAREMTMLLSGWAALR